VVEVLPSPSRTEVTVSTRIGRRWPAMARFTRSTSNALASLLAAASMLRTNGTVARTGRSAICSISRTLRTRRSSWSRIHASTMPTTRPNRMPRVVSKTGRGEIATPEEIGWLACWTVACWLACCEFAASIWLIRALRSWRSAPTASSNWARVCPFAGPAAMAFWIWVESWFRRRVSSAYRDDCWLSSRFT
jgi:hypothetical protein